MGLLSDQRRPLQSSGTSCLYSYGDDSPCSTPRLDGSLRLSRGFDSEHAQVTLGMVLIRNMQPLRGALLVVAQILGGMVAAAIASALLPGPLTAATNLGGGTSVVRGLFIEMFLTSFLILCVFFLAAEKNRGTFIAPVGFGLALFVSMLAGTYFTGASLNPARSFGPCVAQRRFPGYHWIYWVGPGLGAIVSAGFYGMMKALGYDKTNAGVHGPEIEMEAGRGAVTSGQ